MNKPNFSNLAIVAKQALNENLPQILTGAGIVSMAIGVVRATKEAEVAKEKMKEALDKKKEERPDAELNVVDKAKVIIPAYKTAIAFSVIGASMLIGSNVISTNRYASLTAAYAMTNELLRRYKNAVVETVGEKKEKQIRGKAAQKHFEQQDEKNVVVFGSGDSLCVDDWSGRAFYSSIDKIRNVIADINEDFTQGNEFYHSLNYVYGALGIESTKGGDMTGWNFDRDGTLDVSFDAKLTKEGKPYIVMMIDPYPTPDYDKLVY